MNLYSKSKRQIIKYVRLLRRNLNFKQEIIDHLVLNYSELQDQTARRLSELEDVWYKRLIEAEEMYRLKTAYLEKHNKTLTDMIVRGEMLRVNPMIILPDRAKYNGLQSELKALRKQVNDLTVDKAQMINALETLVKFI